MNVKIFRAASLMETLRQVREEFGENARIVQTRDVEEKRFFGLRRIKFVEITAAALEQEPASKPTSTKQNDEELTENFFLRQLRKSPYGDALGTKNEHDGLLSTAMNTAVEESIDGKPAWQPVPAGLWRSMTPDRLNPTVLQRSVLTQFAKTVRFGGPVDLADGKKKTVALIGPSGVGKTATLAKIAAHYRQKEFKRVGFVTVDTYRIAAAEQLVKYADLLDCPVETVSEPFRMKTALAKLSHCDLVLLDTPGTNPKNMARLQTLAAMLDAVVVDERHLVLSSTGSAMFLTDMLRRFAPLRPTDLTLTKLDEAAGLGDLYRFLKDNSEHDHPLPLRFFTLGQNMSEDIEVAGPIRLASLA